MRKEVIGNCTLYLGDCKDIMAMLDKVDVVITDPPYGINIAKWDKEMPMDWFSEALRLIGDSGAAYVFGDSMVISRFQVYWESKGVKWKSRISWVYESGPRSPKAWTTKHEDCLMYSAPNHNQDTPQEKSIHQDPRWGDFRYIGDVWNVPRILGNNKERTEHPTQKPVDLIVLPIKGSSSNGQTILDPFMGSGTTGVACVKMGRSFIGIECDEDYFNIACERIRQAYAQPDMFVSQPTPPEQTTLL